MVQTAVMAAAWGVLAGMTALAVGVMIALCIPAIRAVAAPDVVFLSPTAGDIRQDIKNPVRNSSWLHVEFGAMAMLIGIALMLTVFAAATMVVSSNNALINAADSAIERGVSAASFETTTQGLHPPVSVLLPFILVAGFCAIMWAICSPHVETLPSIVAAVSVLGLLYALNVSVALATEHGDLRVIGAAGILLVVAYFGRRTQTRRGSTV